MEVSPRREEVSRLSEVPKAVGYRKTSLGPLSESSTIKAMPRSDVSLVFDFFCRAEPLVEALVVRRELIIFLVKGLVLDAVYTTIFL